MDKETHNKKVGSKLSNQDPQTTDFPVDEHSSAEAIENPENSTDATKASNEITAIGATVVAVAGSAFSMFKTVLSKSVVTVKDTAANLEMTGSVTDTAKKALEKGTDAVKGAAANLHVPDSMTGAAKNLLDKSMDTIKQTKAIIGSEDSLADKAKNMLSGNNNGQHETSSETNDAALQADEQFTAKTVETDGVDALSATADNAQTIIDTGGEVVSEVIGDIDQTTAEIVDVADEIEMPALETLAEPVHEDINAAEDNVSMVNPVPLTEIVDDSVSVANESEPQVLEAVADDSSNTVDVEHSPAWGDKDNTSVDIETIAVDTDGMSATKEKTLDEIPNEVVADAQDANEGVNLTQNSAGMAPLGSLAKPVGNAVDEALTTPVANVDATGSVPVLDQTDIDTLVPGSESNDELMGATASTGQSGFRWILPVVLLALIGAAAWWLTSFQSKQTSAEMTASLPEAASMEQSQKSTVTPIADVDGSQADENSTTPETTNEVSDNKIVDDMSLTTSSGMGAETVSVQTGIDTDGNKPDADSSIALNVAAVQTINPVQAETVTDKTNDANMIQTLQAGGPVEAIADFLESSDAISVSKGFILHGLNFDIDSSDISENSTKIITDLVTVLNAYPNIKIRLEGHTDSTGDADANQELSATRANAVKTRLVSLNIDPVRISTIGLGESYPITADDTQAWQSINRRVEVIITDR
ncbi:MAG: OmpA family protein [Methylococcales bacterium]